MEEMEMGKRGSEQNDGDGEGDDDTKPSAVKRVKATKEGGGGGGGDGGAVLGDDIMSWLSMDDDTMSELMNLLDTTATQAESEAPVTRVKFIDNPYSSPLIFQSSSSYVTINGNEESCGSSFSDLESSVMVSVDMGGISNVGLRRGCEVGAWSSNEPGGGGSGGDGLSKREEMVGSNCNVSDLNDYNVLERFLMEEAVF